MGAVRRSIRAAGVPLLTVAVAGAVVASCTAPPPPPADPGPPVISRFVARTERSAAPVVAALQWTVSDPRNDPLVCRVDTDGDGTFDETVDPCRSRDSLLAQFDTAGTRTLTLEVDDGEFDPVVQTLDLNVDPGPSESYEITLRLDPAMRQEFRDAFTDAAERWQEVLVAGVADIPLQLPAGLFGWVPAFDGVVDDVLIDARDTAIDGPGQILGRAGGLLIREPRWQPYYGVMEFDTADLDDLLAQGRLGDVILHEMGHVLGIGPSWLLSGFVDDLLVDPAYNGPAGIAAYQALGGDRFVPVEDTGQLGTVIGHWREAVFGNELMTGFLGTGLQPMSEVTIAALADLGYGVDLTQADPYLLPNPLLSALRSGGDEGDHEGDHDQPHTEPLAPFGADLPEVLPSGY